MGLDSEDRDAADGRRPHPVGETLVVADEVEVIAEGVRRLARAIGTYDTERHRALRAGGNIEDEAYRGAMSDDTIRDDPTPGGTVPAAHGGPGAELVVLLDAAGRPIGSAPKASVHGSDTPRHLAFSCHVIDRTGRVLVTRRSLHKQTWPGVWTNSFCGHPVPDEPLVHALRRHGEFELGLSLEQIEPVLPSFEYRATDAFGMVENELCPVYLARTDDDPVPHPGEVMDLEWVDPADLARALQATPWAFSPWLVLQATQLPLLGGRAEPDIPAT